MKKIASEKNYRMFKKAVGPDPNKDFGYLSGSVQTDVGSVEQSLAYFLDDIYSKLKELKASASSNTPQQDETTHTRRR